MKTPAQLDPNEPSNLAEAITRMGLSHAVITVVNETIFQTSAYRDCIMEVHKRSPEVGLELLCSDLDETSKHWPLLYELPLSVFAHNVECVPRLDPIVRDPRASFAQSLRILSEASYLRP